MNALIRHPSSARAVGSRAATRAALALLGLAGITLGLSSGLGNGGSAAAAAPADRYYVALGDSLAFGLQRARFQAEVESNTYDPATFASGYVDQFAARLNAVRPGTEVVNFSCSGETSSSLLKGGCPYHTRALPLHYDYPVATTQMQAALAFLRANSGKVQLITLNVGGNDLGELFFDLCNKDLACAQAALPGVLGAYQKNLDQTLTTLQGAAPSSEVIVLLQYNPYLLSIAASVPAFQALNATTAAVAKAHRVQVADGASPFTASTLCSLTFICEAPLFDLHPRDAGYKVLADAIWAASSYSQPAPAAPSPSPAPLPPATGTGLSSAAGDGRSAYVPLLLALVAITASTVLFAGSIRTRRS